MAFLRGIQITTFKNQKSYLFSLFFENNISDGSQNSGITYFCIVLHPEDRVFVVDYFYNIHKEIY